MTHSGNSSSSVREAFRYCEEIARRHYENFPVASMFLPKHLRPPVAAIYAFARTADDFADEGLRSPAERLELLDNWQKMLEMAYEGEAELPIFVALRHVIHERGIPRKLLSDLLTAFRMDVTIQRYKSFEDVIYYCRHSANPVGRLVLHLFDDASERNVQLSDNICTGLQLANFWQDVSVDVAKGRSYIPLEDIDRFGYTETALARRQFDEHFARLMKFEVRRTHEIFEAGKALLDDAVPELRFELRLVWNGGVTILKKIEQRNFNVLVHRPKIGTVDKISILMESIFRRSYERSRRRHH